MSALVMRNRPPLWGFCVCVGKALAAAAALVVAACSTPDATNLEPKTPTGDERDTELKHEPCDFTASSANRVDVNSYGKPDIIHVMEGGRRCAASLT